MNRIYAAIDLKSFYASVECMERNLNPLRTNLVVADNSRTEKTICLAVSPSLKAYGIPGRARLFEVIQKVKNANNYRRRFAKNNTFIAKSFDAIELKNNKDLELDYITAPPRMSLYMKYSKRIYNTYLKYISADDIYVYSIDEIFCDLTSYLNTYKLTAKELVTRMIRDVYETTGITATAGIGTNLFLAKVAMDIVAKHTEPNSYGVRIAELDEMSFRRKLWNHRPITDFWRVGKGYSKRLEKYRIFTMGDVARCSLNNENLLYKLFGVNAELLIDHAWGCEPTTIEEVKAYKPERNSISSGQVLHSPYKYENAKLIVREMIDLLSLDLTDKHLVTKQLVLDIGYDIENLTNPAIKKMYNGEITIDNYGREVPKHSHGTINLDYNTSSSKVLSKKCIELYDRIVNKNLLIRKINITACNIIDEDIVEKEVVHEQLNLFSSSDDSEQKIEDKKRQKEDNKLQHVLLDIKNKYGKNSILKGMNLEEGGTTIDRNNQVGGHKG